MRRSRFAQVLSWICLTSIALVSFTASSAAQNSSGFGGSNVPRGIRKGVNKPRLECIEFEEFGTGAIVSTIDEPLGSVLVNGHNPDLGNTNAAIIFDSANPTGGDFDLGTPNQNFGGPGIGESGGPTSPFSNEVAKGNILIIAENLLDANNDDHIDDPDDADVFGAGLSIDMTALGGVEIVSLFFIDGETDRPPALIHFFDPSDTLITQIAVPQVGNNGVVTLPVGVQNVARMFFNINGSFGLDDICYRPMVDCNENGIQDYRDILDGTSNDCNSNGIPDECEPDCDSDGIPDSCEPDCDNDGAPDDCELDCDSDGTPDDCEPDCDDDGIPDDCEADCDADGTPDECEPDCDSDGIPDDCEDDCDDDGTPDDCEPDCDSDGIPDDCEDDCDTDGTPDDCEEDCDEDGVPDDCEDDCDTDGIPDDCEDDCDMDGTPDDCEPDSDMDGIPDDCDPCTGQIGDFVWNDINRDGIQDPSEPGIEGVTLELKDENGMVIDSTMTGRLGEYNFDELCQGIYTICVDESTLPPEYVPSPCNVGMDDAVDNDCSPKTLFLPDNAIDLTCDFGYNSPCTGLIGDFVWHDLDRDGLQDDGEPGLEGVLIELKDAQGTVIASQTTGPFGFYTFMGLCAGLYTVCVDETTLPDGFVPTLCNEGMDDTIDNDCSPYDVLLMTDDSEDLDSDFGYNTPCEGTIGNFVWDDVDCDGIQDPGELGIESVVVILKDTLGNQLACTTTGPNGEYQFCGLCAGDYVVCVDETTLPPDYSPSICNQGGNDALDNDCTGVLVTLPTDDSHDDTIDFGYCFEIPGGGQGCTPGYWKQPHHFDSYPAPYGPDTLFSDVFEDAFPGLTFVQVLSLNGGGLNALGRHTVAAFLNASSSGVSYDLNPAEVLTLFNDLFPATTPEYNALKNYFENFNEQGCPLN